MKRKRLYSNELERATQKGFEKGFEKGHSKGWNAGYDACDKRYKSDPRHHTDHIIWYRRARFCLQFPEQLEGVEPTMLRNMVQWTGTEKSLPSLSQAKWIYDIFVRVGGTLYDADDYRLDDEIDDEYEYEYE
jgi:ribosome modulation factor